MSPETLTTIITGLGVVVTLGGGTWAGIAWSVRQSKEGDAVLRAEIIANRVEIVGVRTELKADIADLRKEFKADIADLRDELRKTQEDVNEVKAA